MRVAAVASLLVLQLGLACVCGDAEEALSEERTQRAFRARAAAPLPGGALTDQSNGKLRGVLPLELRVQGERVTACVEHSDCEAGLFCLQISGQCMPCSACSDGGSSQGIRCPLDRCSKPATRAARAAASDPQPEPQASVPWSRLGSVRMVTGAVGLVFLIPVQALGTMLAVVFCVVLTIKVLQCLQHSSVRAALKHPRQQRPTVARRRAQERLRAEQRLAAWGGPGHAPMRYGVDPGLGEVVWVREFRGPGRLRRAASDRMPWDTQVEVRQPQRGGSSRHLSSPNLLRDPNARPRAARRENSLGRRAFSEGVGAVPLDLGYVAEMYPGGAEAMRRSLEEISQGAGAAELEEEQAFSDVGYLGSPEPGRAPGPPRELPPVSLPAHMARKRDNLPGQVEESEEIPEGQECAICMEKPQGAVLVPCSHGDMCQGCAEHLLETTKQCPICRAEIRSVKTAKQKKRR